MEETTQNISGYMPPFLPNLQQIPTLKSSYGLISLFSVFPVLLFWMYFLPAKGLRKSVNNFMSRILNFHPLHRYPIHNLSTGIPLPTLPYIWPNGQGDLDKFIGGIENRAQWAKQHGSIYRIWAGMKPEIVLQKPEHVKLVFRDSDQHSKAVNNDSGWLMGEVLGKCLGLISGTQYRTLRSISEPAFRHSTATTYLPLIQQRVTQYLSQCPSLNPASTTKSGPAERSEKENYLIDPVSDFKFLPFLITADILYGPLSPEMEETLTTLSPLREELFKHVISGGVTRHSWSRFLPSASNTLLSNFQTRWARFNHDAYNRARAKNWVDTPVYHLFSAVEDGKISIENATQTLDEMLFANLDVTMGALSWNPVFLAANVDVQETLYRDIKQAEQESMEKYLQSSTTLLHHCVLESSRLKPLAAFSVPQSAPTSRVLDGYLIPSGTSYIVDSYALNIEDPFWGADRYVYRPSRFQGLTASEIRYHLWRFGFGPRQCLGRYVADLIIRVFLVELVKGWEVGFLEGEGAGEKGWERDLGSWITHPRMRLVCERRM
ncbi:cytochrome p450 monooxygenase GliC [Aspergillus karnatakaensis]|uniref:cytochrome P450 monooxygenase gliC n=1 Tax=Aspergillus karnatakaensis TaxID=1810916 RepID=UPI003CCCE575